MSFTVYKSSAGSGKTFTLVAEYLKIILQEPRDYKHLLAITFTNKAAAEMKSRVLGTLRDLAELPNTSKNRTISALLPILTDEIHLSEEEIASRAARALTLILHNYSDFSIGTIDGFSHRVIRSFAHDFGLPVQFQVETESTEMLKTAVDMLLERAGSDEQLTKILVKFLEVRMDDDQGWNIEQILVRFAQILLDEEGEEKVSSLRKISLGDFEKIAGTLRKRVADFEQQVRTIAREATRVIDDAGLAPGDFYHGNQGIAVYFKNLSLGKFEKIQPNSYVLTTLQEDKWYAGKTTQELQARIDGVKPQLQDYYQSMATLLEQHSENYILYKHLATTIFPMAVLNEIERMLTAFKKQSNTVHISEFNRRISSVVLNEPVPFIYERLGERYHHLMIDEFQDTSRMQWQNFIPLIENALSYGHFNLVVGDGKQAIYRFRNGDVSQFANLPKLEGSAGNPIVRQREQILENFFSEKNLSYNYRSKREIVEFNNQLFTHIRMLLDETGQAVYRDLIQTTRDKEGGGYVEITLLETEQEDSLESMNYVEIERILNACLSDGFAAKDIAILCRNNLQSSSIARELIGKGINVVSSESLLLSQSPEVNFLVAMHRFLLERENPITQTEIAAFLFRTNRFPGYSWPELLSKISSLGKRGEGLLSLLQEHGITFQTDELLSLPLYDLFEELIRLFSLQGDSEIYLRFFLDAVLAFLKRENNLHEGFQLWWEHNMYGVSVIVPEGLDAVQTMTIHKSKGLQFPVVIFPFATEKKRNTKKFLWADLNPDPIHGLQMALLKCESDIAKTRFKNQYLGEENRSLLDMINLLYVVMTRPEERLYVITTKPTGEASPVKSVPGILSNFVTSANFGEFDGFRYTLGEPTRHKQSPASLHEEPHTLTTFISNEWRKRFRIRSKAPYAWEMDDPEAQSNYGNRLHFLLSGIRSYEDLEIQLQQSVRTGALPREELDAMKTLLNKLLHHPSLERLYAPEVVVKTEPAILLPDGSLLRPDRVVIEEECAVVVEYKTGRKSQEHVRQLERYGALLLEMGHHRVEKYLVYLHDEIEVIPVN